MKTVIPGCLVPEISEMEFFVVDEAIICFHKSSREVYLSPENLPDKVFDPIFKYLNKNLNYRTGFRLMGCNTPEKEVWQFIKCKLSNNDFQSDISENGKINEEFVNCPFSGHCIGEKYICKANKFKLTKTEIEIIREIQKDLADKQIAYALGKKKTTIRNHVNHINHKLGTNSKNGIVRVAMQYQII